MVFSTSYLHFCCGRPWLLNRSPLHFSLNCKQSFPPFTSLPISISFCGSNSFSYPKNRLQVTRCGAAKQQSGSSVKKRKRVPPKKKDGALKTVDVDGEVDAGDDDHADSDTLSQPYQPLPLPKPPAGFVLDDHGKVLMASSKRIATIVDSTNNLPLECIIRRVFRASRGDDCMLLCPVDTPVQILKSTNIEGWSAV